MGTATSDEVDSLVVVDLDEEVDALRCKIEAEVTRANAGSEVGGVGGVVAAADMVRGASEEELRGSVVEVLIINTRKSSRVVEARR